MTNQIEISNIRSYHKLTVQYLIFICPCAIQFTGLQRVSLCLKKKMIGQILEAKIERVMKLTSIDRERQRVIGYGLF